ncbi:hypothetical protein Y032_0001g431 [Ancylostoma ceylanicum]|uniref:Uncharacterized protein n=1 Tax=Ancylostoma ceylanicum TaxID=53326 RepID=A0A016W4A4_9BILA|nr:hypothetical protein Y032_0001g431 [Ancylostoma ceylanicum]
MSCENPQTRQEERVGSRGYEKKDMSRRSRGSLHDARRHKSIQLFPQPLKYSLEIPVPAVERTWRFQVHSTDGTFPFCSDPHVLSA